MEIPTGTLDKFHLGVSADGQTLHDGVCRRGPTYYPLCRRRFRIQRLHRQSHRAPRPRCRAGARTKATRKREQGPACGTLNVAFAEFQPSPTDAYIEGALVGDAGQIVGIRMAPEVACQLTKAMLMAAPAASSC